MKPELDKCILLCSNCHRVEHYQEDLNKEKTMNEVAQTVTPVTEPIDPAFDALPEFLKQPFKDGKAVEVQGEEEIGEVKETLN